MLLGVPGYHLRKQSDYAAGEIICRDPVERSREEKEVLGLCGETERGLTILIGIPVSQVEYLSSCFHQGPR
jgi:hypothetical protein